MRGYKPGSPVFSTYAVGAGGSARRQNGATRPLGGDFALPVIAILGTASAAAIVSVLFEGQTATTSGPQPGRGDAASGVHSDGRPVGGREAVFSTRFDSSPLIPDGAQQPKSPDIQPARPAGDGRRELPFLTVLQTNRSEPASQAVPESRVNPVSPDAGLPRQPLFASESLPGPQEGLPCVTTCVASEPLEPTAGLVSAVAPDESPGEALVSGPNDASEGALPGGAGPIDSAAVAVEADARAESGLLTDARPTLLVEPSGELIATATDPGARETPAAETDLALSDPGGGREETTAAFEESATIRPDAAESASGSTIPDHLARISERYSAVPASESSPEDQAAAVQSDPASPQLPPGETAIAVGIDGLSSSTVIVQDDELVAIRLGELVSLLEDRFDHPLYVWMKSSAAASKFVTAETLAAAGISTRYDAQRKQIVFSTTGE